MQVALIRQCSQKQAGAYYTPDDVVTSLLQWAVRDADDRLIDPACGDGQFIARHRKSVGIEQDVNAARLASARAPWALVHEGDFFSWASEVTERFECAAGNPPFIRYQHFAGETRARALKLCARLGANFTGLTSSWAPFLAVVAGLLTPGGRLAFVVPAEIGHAPYAAPLLDYLVQRFALVHVVAIREKFFPELSEDCWLLYAEGFSGRTEYIRFTAQERFASSVRPPKQFMQVSVKEWRETWNRRLRPFLIDPDARNLYREIAALKATRRFGDLATVGIGYVSGANEFFHLRPSEAYSLDIPHQFLHPTVRNGRALTSKRLTKETVDGWTRDDDPILLLKIPKKSELPWPVMRYLEMDAGHVARKAYKCRMRDPWYSVPDVQVPDFFLTYMSGREPILVRNEAGCTCTNSVHAVRIKGALEVRDHLASWGSNFVQLSCEIEGHPLGA
jgi:adenine-specific DNA-methyltransferase